MYTKVFASFLTLAVILAGTVGLFLRSSSSVFAAGLTLYTDTSYCPPCRTLEGWLNSSAGKSVVSTIGGLPKGGGVPPDGGGIPALFKGGQRIGSGPAEIQSLLQNEAQQARPKQVGAVLVGTDYVYVGPNKGVTGPDMAYDFKPSDATQPSNLASSSSALSQDKQFELARNVASGNSSVKLGSANVKPGAYVVGTCTNGVEPMTKDENSFKGCTPEQPGPLGGNENGNLGGGDNGGGGLGGGGLGGMESLLPLLLMQSLLGGQQNQGQNGQGNNGYGSNNSVVDCSTQGTFPVCGSNGVTYTNSCWEKQYGVQQVSTGVCTSATPTPQPTPDLTHIVTQLVASGVPQNVINTIITEISQLFSHSSGETTVP